MSAPSRSSRSRVRRAGASAYGALLLARMVLLGLVVAVLVAAGAWSSWDTARNTLLSDGTRGSVTLMACDRDACTGVFDATGDTVVLEQSVAREPGERLSVVRRPDTDEVVRTGAAGGLYACLPLTGALLLSSVVVGGGLRMRRTAWSLAGTGLAALAATFAFWI